MKTKTLYDFLEEDDRTMADKIAPLFTWRGVNVYPVSGAEGDDGGDNTDPDGEPGEGEGDDDDNDGGSPDGTSTVSRDDFERLKAQLSAADKKREAAEQAIKKIEDGKKDELTKATEKVTELEKGIQVRDSELAEMRLQNAFLTADTGITWHDPADALALAERQGYLAEVVEEGGKVNSAKLATKLKELAKAKPHLVKSGKEDGDTGGKNVGAGSGKNGSGTTGSKVGSKGQGGTKDSGPDLSRYARHLNR